MASSLQATCVNEPQDPVNTAISVSNELPQVYAVIVPHTPVTAHHMFLYGPSHVVVGASSVAAVFDTKGLV